MTDNYLQAEKMVAEYLTENGFQKVQIQPINFPNIDLVADKGGKHYGFQVKNWRKKASRTDLQSFNDKFVESSEANSLAKVFYLAKSGFARTAYQSQQIGLYSSKLEFGSWLEEEDEQKILYMAGVDDAKDKKLYEEIFPGTEYKQLDFDFQEAILRGEGSIIETTEREVIRLAVCTLKGGVGKTSVAVNLAGTFAGQGLDVSLVDCDSPQYSLLRLFAPEAIAEDLSSIEIESKKHINVYKGASWKEQVLKTNKEKKPVLTGLGDLVIYDCPPRLDEQDRSWEWIFQNADLCILPINICPIGLGKAGLSSSEQNIVEFSVIDQTIQAIRRANPEIEILIVENNKMKTKENKKVEKLRETLNNALQVCLKEKVKLADAFIRHSEKIYYWGFDQTLPINNNAGGQCLPKQDFQALSDEIQEIMKEKNINKRNQYLTNYKEASKKLLKSEEKIKA